jgi:signal transduction histidine kinase
MNSPGQSQTNQDLMFFGKVNASISHELKNILAIISETAGLMSDLMELAAQGKKVEPNTLLTCSRDIMEEIQRGFLTIKRMNTFSHSVDEVVREINIYDMLDMVIDIVGYLSYTGKVQVNKQPSEEGVIRTCPFRLQHVVYGVLTAVFQKIGAEGAITIAVVPEDDHHIGICFLDIRPEIGEMPQLGLMHDIAGSIGAVVRMDSDGQNMSLVVPRHIDAVQ